MTSVFVDTSAFFAGVDHRDLSHLQATATWARLFEARDTLVTHALVEVETCALMQRRLGLAPMADFRDNLLTAVGVFEIDRDERAAAFDELIASGRRRLSLVDRVSFSFMRRLGITTAFAFDRHFAEAGFELVGPGEPS